jgi:cystathionine beta-lyase/cystathionine gamma-synthase
MSVSDKTVRISVGLEDGEDLLADIKQALAFKEVVRG